ncbi:LMxysn_1693 family intestinal colonization protein [Listeria costaricensis]|uniref:LMxysn_1693 family intestinal colonization protein n=1 Tax=Listeria costaricensis TaxID=2026604 RepID=UPI000C073352|nr:hypothetical protein [Listeria costaricensis]
MKNKSLVLLLAGALAITVVFPGTTVFAKENQNNGLSVNTPMDVSIFSSGDLVQENTNGIMLREATGFHYKTVSQSVTKGSRVYLGTKTYSKGTNFGVKAKVGPVFVSLGGYASKSGNYKEYRQNVKITVKVKKYENGSGRYVGTYTYTSNTSYVDRIPV